MKGIFTFLVFGLFFLKLPCISVMNNHLHANEITSFDLEEKVNNFGFELEGDSNAIDTTLNEYLLLKKEDCVFSFFQTGSKPSNSIQQNITNINADPPIANAAGGYLHCSGVMKLNAHGSSTGEHISYHWSTFNGSIIADENTSQPTINSAGIYTLRVVDNISKLSSSLSVSVLPATHVDAGEDILYCDESLATVYQLSGYIDGHYLDYQWRDSPNLDNRFVLNPNVTATEVATHSLDAKILAGTNLIVNGNFESGNFGFYTQYIEGTDVSGKYLVTSQPKDFYNGFAGCGDHTLGYGKMMVLDGSTLSNQKVWCQTVEVEQQRTYSFSAWFQNVCATCLWGEPIIDFRANGQSLGIVQKKGPGCSWEQFTSFWESGNAISAEFCLYTNDLDPVGNDFAIDDIEVYASCIQSDKVEVKLDDIDIAFDDVFISCNSEEVNLVAHAIGSDVTNVSYQWDTSTGVIVEGGNSSNPIVVGEGIYELRLTNLNTNCSPLREYELMEIENLPELELSSEMFSCENREFIIEIDGDLTDLSYSWSTADGNIVSGSQSENVVVNSPGTYFLIASQNQSGCTAEFMHIVTDESNLPELLIQPSSILTCHDNETYLTAEFELPLEELDFFWSSMDGTILEGEQSHSPLIGQPGTYLLTITNKENGCTNSASIDVESDYLPPEIEVSEDAILGCETTTISVQANSINENISFLWSSSNGNILNELDQSEIEVNAPGIYTVLIINEDNGCSVWKDVTVIKDAPAPFADAGQSSNLNCQNDMVQLDASNSDQAEHLMYSWYTDSGNIVSGENTLTPVVDQTGVYILNVLNTINQCSTISTVSVFEDYSAPPIEAGTDKVINCKNETIDLGIDGLGDNLIYSWSTLEGLIIGANDNSSSRAAQAGLYFLEVSNPNNGCVSFDTTHVQEDFVTPDALLSTENALLNCMHPSTSLQVESNIADIDIKWISSNGNILTDPTKNIVEVDEAALYTAIVIDPNNGCQNSEDILVEESFDLPRIEFQALDKFLCNTDEMEIITINIDEGDFVYNWKTENGNIVGSNDLQNVLVSSPGIYELETSSLVSGCKVTQSIEVVSDLEAPEINFIRPEILTCQLTSVDLGVESDSDEFIFFWSTESGNFLGSANQDAIQVTSPGTYRLQLQDRRNFCTSTKEIDVFADIVNPIILIQEPETLTCSTTETILDASAFSNSLIFKTTWSTENGNILNGENTLTPTINLPGEYNITIENISNDCRSSSSVSVDQNVEFPRLEMSKAETLTCKRKTTFIDLDYSDDARLNFNWNSNEGNILSDPGLPRIELDAAGSYIVEVLNLDNDCVSIFEQQVSIDTVTALIDAGSGFEIQCNYLHDNLAGEVLTSSNVNINWFTHNGSIVEGASTLTPLVDDAGVYYLEVTNTKNSCISLDSLIVSRNNNLPYSIDLNIMEPLCFEEPGQLIVEAVSGGEGPFLYSVNGTAFVEEIYYDSLDAGNRYDISVLDNYECRYDTFFVVPSVPKQQLYLQEDVSLNIGDDHYIHVATNIDESEILDIIWSPSNYLSCVDCLDPKVTPLSDQNYSLTIITKNGCIAADDILFKVDENINIYAPDAFSPYNYDGINDEFFLMGNPNVVDKINFFEVYDRWGNKVFEINEIQLNDSSNAWKGFFKGRKAGVGVYTWSAGLVLVSGTHINLKGNVSILD